MNEFRKKHFIIFDSMICLVLVAAFFVIDWKMKLDIFSLLSKNENLKNFYKDLFNISVTIFLFLVTSLSVLFAFSDNSKLKILENTEHPKTMFDVFINAIICTGLFSVMLIPTFFICNEWLFWILLYGLLICVARVFRVICILKNLTSMIIRL